MGCDGGADVVEGIAFLLTAGFDDGQHRFYEAASRITLRTAGGPGWFPTWGEA
jgi:hypothetical protein